MTDATATPAKLPNRWLIAGMGTALQLCLGTVYAWSFWQNPVMYNNNWSNSSAIWIFCLAICFLGLAAAVGGMLMPKTGPRPLAIIGGILFAVGHVIAAFALEQHSLFLFCLGYGVIGGCGLGLGYVTPVATVAKWFPDRKGLATGMVVMGFGLGALLMSKVFAPTLMEKTALTPAAVVERVQTLPVTFYEGKVDTFKVEKKKYFKIAEAPAPTEIDAKAMSVLLKQYLEEKPASNFKEFAKNLKSDKLSVWALKRPDGKPLEMGTFIENVGNGDLFKVWSLLGGIFLVLTLIAAWFIRNPPAGYKPAGWNPPAPKAGTASAGVAADLTAKDSIFSMRFSIMWIIFFCNIAAGIMFIGFQSPLYQDLLSISDPKLTAAELAAAGGTLIGITSLFNGLGRFFWGGLSDKIGRKATFSIMLLTQVLVFVGLMFNGNPILFGIMVCYVMLCYGGGFGTMPSFVLDVFGAKLMPVVYGTILTAWSAAGIVGPQIAGLIKDKIPGDQQAMWTYGSGISFLAFGFLLTFLINNKPFEKKHV